MLKAGHTSFRDARGPLGLTQRQAGGKFTRDEASTLIDQLLLEDTDGDGEPIASMESTRAEEQLEAERPKPYEASARRPAADEVYAAVRLVRSGTSTPPVGYTTRVNRFRSLPGEEISSVCGTVMSLGIPHGVAGHPS